MESFPETSREILESQEFNPPANVSGELFTESSMEILESEELKCHYDQILDTHFFTLTPTQKVFPSYLGKFQSITNIRTHVFWTFISDSLRPPLIFLVPSLD